MAGFQLSINGRFWVSTEGILSKMARASPWMALFMAVTHTLVAVCLALGLAVASTSYAYAVTDLGLPHYRSERALEESWALSFVKARVPRQDWADLDIVVSPWRPSVSERVWWFIESARYWVSHKGCCHDIEVRATVGRAGQKSELVARGPAQPVLIEGIFYDATTLVPTAILVAMIALAVWAKVVLAAVRTLVLRILRVVTEVNPKDDPRDFMPATLVALVISSLTFVLKLALDIVSAATKVF